jgi:hypothetical protein
MIRPACNPNLSPITGAVRGVHVETIESLLM